MAKKAYVGTKCVTREAVLPHNDVLGAARESAHLARVSPNMLSGNLQRSARGPQSNSRIHEAGAAHFLLQWYDEPVRFLFELEANAFKWPVTPPSTSALCLREKRSTAKWWRFALIPLSKRVYPLNHANVCSAISVFTRAKRRRNLGTFLGEFLHLLLWTCWIRYHMKAILSLRRSKGDPLHGSMLSNKRDDKTVSPRN